MIADWRAAAACRDMDLSLFFPDIGYTVPMACVTACGSCPVRAECLEEALADPLLIEYGGYRGGLTPKGRRRVWAERRAADRTQVA